MKRFVDAIQEVLRGVDTRLRESALSSATAQSPGNLVQQVAAPTLGWPNSSVSGDSEEATIEHVRQAIRARLAQGKTVRV